MSRDHETASVLAQVPRKAAHGAGDLQPKLDHAIGGVQAVLLQAGLADPLQLGAIGAFCKPLDLVNGKAERFRSATHRMQARMPFAVWMALAKSQPLRGLDEGVQGVLADAL